jgi:hypothetical protein
MPPCGRKLNNSPGRARYNNGMHATADTLHFI